MILPNFKVEESVLRKITFSVVSDDLVIRESATGIHAF